MIINNGPIGRKFNPLKDLLIKFEDDSDYSFLNLTGINNKYKLYKEGIRWCLLIFSSCDINFLKKNKRIDIGLIGGGGGGGENRNAANADDSAGGGGGAGGERVTQYSQVFQPQIYQLTIGAGGAFKKNGDNSSIAYNGDIIFEANGGLAGAAPIPTTNDQIYWEGAWYDRLNYANGGIGGNGGSSNTIEKTYIYSSYGGDGSAKQAWAASGEDGMSLFSSSILQGQQDMIIVGAGGGGGHGFQYSGGTFLGNGAAGLCGNGSIYGKGGTGQLHKEPSELANVSTAGEAGLIIIRSY